MYGFKRKGGDTVSQQQKDMIYPIRTDKSVSDIKEHDAKAPEPEAPVRPPLSLIVTEIVLILIALVCTAVFGASLFTQHTFEYIHTETPAKIAMQASAVPSETANEDDIPVPVHIPVYYDFTSPVPESDPVDLSYFSDTVFIGDSRTKGLILYTSLTPYDFSSVGTNVKTVQLKPFIRVEDENGEAQSITLFEALERESGNYKSVYIALGLNELGWSPDNFVYNFRELIANIRNITDKPIYVQLIIPVTTYASEHTQYGITNEKAVLFNEHLRTECAELELFMLDPTELFTLEDGTLDPAHASDGIHLMRASYGILANYYASHIVDTEAYDNTKTTTDELTLP